MDMFLQAEKWSYAMQGEDLQLWLSEADLSGFDFMMPLIHHNVHT